MCSKKQKKAKEFVLRKCHHYIAVFIVSWALFSLVVGCSSVDKGYVATNYKASQEFGEDLKNYHLKNEEISPATLKILLDSLESWKRMNKFAYEKHVLNIEGEENADK